MKSIKDVNFKDRKVLLRVDFNVPMDDNKHITDDTRMSAVDIAKAHRLEWTEQSQRKDRKVFFLFPLHRTYVRRRAGEVC